MVAKNYPQALRIIGGQWRGRKISIPAIEGLRPTPNRIRETLFNWLGQDILQRRCLDLFAGSGALGIEALSRGASFVSFIDNHPIVVKSLRENCYQLTQAGCDITKSDCLTWLEQTPSEPYSIIFLDPPFHQELLHQCFALLESNRWLADNALVYVEHEATLVNLTPPKSWHLLRNKTAGQVGYRLYQRSIPLDQEVL